MSRITEFLLHAFFPTRCIFCDTVQVFGVVICDSCLTNIKNQQAPQAIVKANYSFSMAVCPFFYDMGVNNAIINLKFNGAASNGKKLAEFMFYSLENLGVPDSIELAVPIPLHPIDKKNRGYNQSEILCKALCSYMQIPHDNSILVKTKQTSKQHRLSSSERTLNLIDAFEVVFADAVKDKVILLVDDVFTTGTTMEICSQKLLKAGASKIICVAAAKTYFKSDRTIESE